MPELGEMAAVAMAAEIVDKCPFPHEETKHDKTNDLSNVASTLGDNIGGGDDREITVTLRGKSKPMDLGFQAHHLIPGASIKGASELLKFVKSGGTVKADIGYLQNDERNGAWLPGLHKFEGWGELSKDGGYEIQFAYAYAAMEAAGCQFHMWDSSHKDYNAFVRRTLEEIRLKMLELRTDCDKCDDQSKKPWDPPYELVSMLYALAHRMKGYVTGSKGRWFPPYCTSDFAVLAGAGMTPDKFADL